MLGFNVTYEIVTKESAEQGDAEERGFICESVSLREAIDALNTTRTAHCDGVQAIETDEYPVRAPRWITITNGMEFYTGACESRSLHIPETATDATRRRIARLCGVHVS